MNFRKKTFLFPILLLIPFLLFGNPQFGGQVDFGLIEHDPIDEASGIVASRKNADVFWTHNDSGNDNVIYAFNISGEHLGVYTIDGIINRDWEDLALGPGPDDEEDYIYLGDIGDNGLQNDLKYIYRFIEPEVFADQEPVTETISDAETITFEYPDQILYDAETLMLESLSKDIYVVTKRNGGIEDVIFRAAYPQSTTETIILEQVATIDIPTFLNYGSVGGDISVSGLEILIKTYSHIYYWSRKLEDDLWDAFDDEPFVIPYAQEPQGEAVCWRADGMGYFTISEENPQLPLPAHLYFYPRLDNYITITHIPTGLFKENEALEITWSPTDLECGLYFSSSPGGEDIENYLFSEMISIGSINTTPGELDLGVGVYYCILHNTEYDYTSIEFIIRVESSEPVNMLSPVNGSEVTDATPTFTWDPNPGVPYYFLVLSDNPFTIDEDENGNPIVVGVQPIWQIITPNTSAVFGSADPSGFFDNVVPPLVSGIEYNWIVANNYGNDPLLTSRVVSSPFGFEYTSAQLIDPPILINPPDSSIINADEIITFEWSNVEEAMFYHIFLYEVRFENDSEVFYPVWNQSTTSTSIEFNAQNILINSEYDWKVYATNENNISSVSEDFRFFYDTTIGTLNLTISNIDGVPIGYATAELDPVNGSNDIVPLVVGANGHEVKLLTPGDYVLTCSKEGYESSDTLITVFEDPFPDSPQGDTFVEVILEFSPSNFYGSIKDNEGYLVENITVFAENEEGEIRSVESISGHYNIGVIPGLWTISADKEGYTLQEPIESLIIAGENIQLDDLIMIENEKDLIGYVKNSFGVPIPSATVTMTSSSITRTKSTNSSGYYNFQGVSFGTWTIFAEKEGYYSSDPVIIDISQSSPDMIVMDDFILNPDAGIVFGNANNGVVGLESVEITATPEVGFPIRVYANYYGDYTLHLSPGSYEITASLSGYTSQNIYNLDLDVGETIGYTDFFLIPDNLTIFGMVSDIEENPLENAVVQATNTNRNVKGKINRDTFMDTTNAEGFYSLRVDLLGEYSVFAAKENYYDSELANIEITTEQTGVEQDFMLEHIELFASIHGSVTIFDEVLGQIVPPDQASLILQNGLGEEIEISLLSPDSLYGFNDLLIPDIFSIEVTVNYSGQEFYQFIPNIEITEEVVFEQDFHFIYNDDTVTLSGSCFMIDNGMIPLFNAEVVLKDEDLVPLDTTYTNQNGFYQFNNLSEGTRILSYEIEYGEEHFYGESDPILWTGSNIILDDYIFNYFLCSIDFFMTNDGFIPINGATVTISSPEIDDIILVTNNNGYCSVNNILHTGNYTIDIDKNYGPLGKYIESEPYQIVLDTLGYYVQEKQIPLQFDESQISGNFLSSEQIEITLFKTENYSDPVSLHYYDVHDSYFEIEMNPLETQLTATIPEQETSGVISFWFTSDSPELELNFSNETYPFELTISSEGVPFLENSYIIPKQPVFVFTQEANFEVNVYDEIGNCLNAVIDSFGTVVWSIDPALGELFLISGEKRKVTFAATENVVPFLDGSISSEITLNGATVSLEENIQLKDIYLANLVFDQNDIDKISNDDSYFSTISAFSENGISMTVPIEYEILPELIGTISGSDNFVHYDPNDKFISEMQINIFAFDPRSGTKISTEKSLEVYKFINQNTLNDTCFTGKGCNLLIYSTMLDTLFVQQDNIYLNSIDVAPFKKIGVRDEVLSNVFHLSSEAIQNDYNILPGLIFETSEFSQLDNFALAYWDGIELEWKIIETDKGSNSNESEIILPNVPYLFGDYSVTTNSAPLGLYDLKLRPNPFTPLDQIGANTGLQIEFRLSSDRTRYPKITAKIYTVNGTLVRTITSNTPMLKGNYQAGETETLYWDGRTDEGRLARNGRYLIQLIAEDTKSREEILKSIVLIK